MPTSPGRSILSVIIGIIFSSAFSAIVVFAQELMPGRIGMIAGIFFGFAFGSGGIAAAALGRWPTCKGIDFVFQLTSYLPLLGFLTVLLAELRPVQTSGGGGERRSLLAIIHWKSSTFSCAPSRSRLGLTI